MKSERENRLRKIHEKQNATRGESFLNFLWKIRSTRTCTRVINAYLMRKTKMGFASRSKERLRETRGMRQKSVSKKKKKYDKSEKRTKIRPNLLKTNVYTCNSFIREYKNKYEDTQCRAEERARQLESNNFFDCGMNGNEINLRERLPIFLQFISRALRPNRTGMEIMSNGASFNLKSDSNTPDVSKIEFFTINPKRTVR